jgi:hypothetical protein
MPILVNRIKQLGIRVLVLLAAPLVAAAGQTRVPDWELRGRVEMRPMEPGACAFVTIFVKNAQGRLITRPDGNTIGPADFELALSGAGAASFKWERNTPDYYKVCATFAAGPDRADIVITYPRTAMPDDAVYPGVAFSAVIPVYRGSGGGVPDFSLLKLSGAGGAVAVAAAPTPAPAPVPAAAPTGPAIGATPPQSPPSGAGTAPPAAAPPAIYRPSAGQAPTNIGTANPTTPPPPSVGTNTSGAGGTNQPGYTPPPPPSAAPAGGLSGAPSGPPVPVGAPPQQGSGTVAPPLAAGTPLPPRQNVPPAPIPATPGKYRIRLIGFRSNLQTYDDPLNRDGWGDEIFTSTFVTLIDRSTLAVLDSRLVTSKTYGSPGSWPNRAGVATGIVAGTNVPADLDAQLQSNAPGLNDLHPQQLWQGVLDASQAIVLLPSVWEWDGDAKGFQYWSINERRLIADDTTKAAIAAGDWHLRRSRQSVLFHEDRYIRQWANPGHIAIDAGQDRPVGLMRNPYYPSYMVFTREAIEALLASTVGAAPGVVEVRLIDGENPGERILGGDYSLFLKIERVP